LYYRQKRCSSDDGIDGGGGGFKGIAEAKSTDGAVSNVTVNWFSQVCGESRFIETRVNYKSEAL